MTHRERMMAVLEGRPPDRIPWSPILVLWYRAHRARGTLPAKYRGWSEREIYRDMRLGWPARDCPIFKQELTGVEIVTRTKGQEVFTEYITPVGTVSTLRRVSSELEADEIGGRFIHYMIKGVEDYPVMEYIVEHTRWIPRFEEFEYYDRETGEDGVPWWRAMHCPMGMILKDFIGWNNAYYHLYDYTAQVEHLAELLTESHTEFARLAAQSPVKHFQVGIHFHSQMTPPPIFEKYFLPFFKMFNAVLHKAGKLVNCHCDADTKLLLDLIKRSDFDMAESFVTAPMVPVTLKEAREAWGNRIIIWGGIPSTLLTEAVREEEFEEYLLELFRVIAPGDAFILGIADNVVPGAKIERVARITELVEEYGTYPISPP